MLNKIRIWVLRNQLQALEVEFKENGHEIVQLNSTLHPSNPLSKEQALEAVQERAWLLRRQKYLQKRRDRLLVKLNQLKKE